MYSTLPTNGDMTSHISSPDSQYSTLSNKTSDKLTIKTNSYIIVVKATRPLPVLKVCNPVPMLRTSDS